MVDEVEVLDTLVENLGDDDTAIRQEALNTLSRHDLTPRLVDRLLLALRGQKTPLRENAAQVLSRSEDFRVVPPLLQRLEDDTDAQVRMHAALALGKLKDRQAILALQYALKNDHDWRVRRAAAEALKSFTADEIVHNLLQALDDVSEEVIQAAAYSLQERSKQEMATEFLVQQLETAPPDDRPHLVTKLTLLENPNTARLFMQMLKEPLSEIRILAARFLGTMAWKLNKLDQWKAIEELTDVLEMDPHNDVRLEAVFAVGHFKSPQSRTCLILALDDESPIVTEIARGWLREFGYDPEIFGMACVTCGRTQETVDIPFKACLACGKIVCEDDWILHSLGGPFCSITCQDDYLAGVTGV